MHARALRAPVLLGLLTCQRGRCAPLVHGSFAASYSSPKNNYFQKQIASLLAQTRVYLSAGLSCTLLSCIASYWAMQHPPKLHWWLNPNKLYCTLLSYTTPYYAMLHSTELHCTLFELWCILRATLHPLDKQRPSELCCTILSYAAPFRAMLHPTELRLTLNELRGLYLYTVPPRLWYIILFALVPPIAPF